MQQLECQSFYYGDSRLFVVTLKGGIMDESDVDKAMRIISKSAVYSRGNKVRLIVDFTNVVEMSVVGLKHFSRAFSQYAGKHSQEEAFVYCGEAMKINLMLARRLCKREIEILPSFEKCMTWMSARIAETKSGGIP